MLYLVDSNVILDIVTNDPIWCERSMEALTTRAGQLAINPIIYSEVSIGFKHMEDVEKQLKIFQKLPLPFEAGFLTGKAFLNYRKNKEKKEKSLPDFYIGAHAVTLDIPLITRDQDYYTTYFPTLKLIHP